MNDYRHRYHGEHRVPLSAERGAKRKATPSSKYKTLEEDLDDLRSIMHSAYVSRQKDYLSTRRSLDVAHRSINTLLLAYIVNSVLLAVLIVLMAVLAWA